MFAVGETDLAFALKQIWDHLTVFTNDKKQPGILQEVIRNKHQFGVRLSFPNKMLGCLISP